MKLRQKLDRLRSALPSVAVEPERVIEPEPVRETQPSERAETLSTLRARMRAVIARTNRVVHTRAPDEVVQSLPFAPLDDALESPRAHARTKTFDATGRHGRVALHSALDAVGHHVALLSLDTGLSAFDPRTALFLDTETTGLHGGTAMIPFLIGLGRFDGMSMQVEQLFVADPADESEVLRVLATRFEQATSIVTFNGKSFDLPLLRARYVMSRMRPPKELPHLDLVHAARRVYGARLEACRLVEIEREVLGFERVGDVPSGEIPQRYVQFLRTRDPTPLLAVIEHNVWDIVAMAALLGEMTARVRQEEGSGRFDATDMASLAHTVFRAGNKELSLEIASRAVSTGMQSGDQRAIVRASRVAARVATQRGDWRMAIQMLTDLVAIDPSDGVAHLQLARLYESQASDPTRALMHARQIGLAEPEDVLRRRVQRLERKVRHEQLRLPGIE